MPEQCHAPLCPKFNLEVNVGIVASRVSKKVAKDLSPHVL